MSRIIIENKVLNKIPLNEYYIEGVKYKGLVYIQHGFESNKNRGADYLAINLARLGFFVVSIDAYKHGERIEEPFISMQAYKRYSAVFDVITVTVENIIDLHKNFYMKTYPKYDFIGVSMGGLIAYHLAVKTDLINKLIPVISSPMFLELSTNTITKEDLDLYHSVIENNLDYINSIDPINFVDELSYSQLFILNTSNDKIVPARFSKDFYRKYKNDKMTFKIYDDIHDVNREMQTDILSFIANEKVVL